MEALDGCLLKPYENSEILKFVLCKVIIKQNPFESKL